VYCKQTLTSPQAKVHNDPGEAEKEEELYSEAANLVNALAHFQHFEAENIHCCEVSAVACCMMMRLR
jgi:hypothetical protein